MTFHCRTLFQGEANQVSPVSGNKWVQGGNDMAKAVFEVPALWADHHVLKIRDALTSLEGVEEVYASSAWKQVLVAYDGGKVKRPAIEKALTEAGYPVGAGEIPLLVQPADKRRDPQWEVLGARVTETNQVDLEMSGEFRRY
jgi:copper chaperone CopZ